MSQRVKLFGVLGLFWVGYFLVIRLVFLLYNYDLTADLTALETINVFLHGLRMDLSVMGYYLVLYGLILLASILVPGGAFSKIIKSITVFLLLLSGAITVVDMELYRHWGFRLNNTPFFYMGPGALGSISFSVWVKGLLTYLLLTVMGLYAYQKWIQPTAEAAWQPVTRWYSLAMLGLTGLMILPIRGSLTVAPMNVGFVFFHRSKPYANHAAINVVWNFMASLKKSATLRYPEDFVEPELAASQFQTLYPDTENTPRITKTDKPNILLIILEGFTADVVKPLGGLDNIAPRLNQLCEEGILFTNIYASGDRTDKGVVCVLSGYPAQPQTSIAKLPSKTANLPSLAKSLKKQGYQTSFLYGGDVNFANLRSYTTQVGFEHITDLGDFPAELNTSKWGVHDQYVFERAKKELAEADAPFFKVILTLSSHEPFDVPMEPYITGNSEEELYLNSCYYTDKWLGEFIDYAKTQSWWDSTLVVITADHGHRHPNNKRLEDERRFRIPLLLLGGALAEEARQVDMLGGQTDIANTILSQLQGPEKDFRFSKDLLNPASRPFAAYYFQNGYGFVLPGRNLVYDHNGKQFVINNGCDSTDMLLSKAYQQVLFSDYNRR